MSAIEKRRRNMVRHVCKQAWIYLKRTSIDSLSCAMRLAWMKIQSRLFSHYTKVRGVTFEDRQRLLNRLSKYKENDIILTAERVYDNPYDRYAIEIIATVQGKGSGTLGYISKALSQGLAVKMDEGAWLIPIIENITGGTAGRPFGLNFSYLIIE